MQKMINDYAEEYDDCMSVLDEPLREHSPQTMFKPRVEQRRHVEADPLFEEEEDDTFNAIDQWQDMPEYDNREIKPYKRIVVSFMSKEEMDAFSELVEQKITEKTKSIYYPKQDAKMDVTKRWVDEMSLI